MATWRIPDGSVLLTPSQVAEWLQVEEGTLRRWRYCRGRGPPYVLLHHHTRYLEHEVRAWLATRQRRPRRSPNAT